MFDLITNRDSNVKNDVLSGITVALALVPEAVAFAFVAGVEPMIGLYAAFMMGLITSAIGGRPGMISGATGAMAGHGGTSSTAWRSIFVCRCYFSRLTANTLRHIQAR